MVSKCYSCVALMTYPPYMFILSFLYFSDMCVMVVQLWGDLPFQPHNIVHFWHSIVFGSYVVCIIISGVSVPEVLEMVIGHLTLSNLHYCLSKLSDKTNA